MSHKATQWLVDIDPKKLTHGAFRVLFHLCDCHNAAHGCFPSQRYLAEKSGLSHSGVNKVLAGLEAAGLITRHRSVDPATRRQRPTRYMLAFEVGFKPRGGDEPEGGPADGDGPEPCPLSGHGKAAKPGPLSGHGAVSTFGQKPCPLSGKSRVHRGGHKPVKEPVREPRGPAGGVSQNPMVAASAQRLVKDFRAGRPDAIRDAKPWERAHIEAAQLLTLDELQTIGWAENGGLADGAA